MSILDRIRAWFASRPDDPIMSSPSEEAQLELTSREQEEELLDEGKAPRD